MQQIRECNSKQCGLEVIYLYIYFQSANFLPTIPSCHETFHFIQRIFSFTKLKYTIRCVWCIFWNVIRCNASYRPFFVIVFSLVANAFILCLPFARQPQMKRKNKTKLLKIHKWGNTLLSLQTQNVKTVLGTLSAWRSAPN